MGRPDGTPSPRINNNPMYQAQPAPQPPMLYSQPPPEPPVYEKQMVPAEQNYPSNAGMVNQPSVGMVNQPSGVPMGRPGQPTYVNTGGVPMGRPGQPTYVNTGGVPMLRPGQPTYINTGGMGNQPPYGVPMVRPPPYTNQPSSNWSSGLFDCMNDAENTIITFCFPFVTFGQIAEIIDEGATSCGTAGLMYVLILCFLGMPCVYTCTYRTKLRSKYGLPEAPAPDWITHFFCEYCAICQEYRELKSRGFDPAIGWIGNVQKQRRELQHAMMTPPMGQRMMG